MKRENRKIIGVSEKYATSLRGRVFFSIYDCSQSIKMFVSRKIFIVHYTFLPVPKHEVLYSQVHLVWDIAQTYGESSG